MNESIDRDLARLRVLVDGSDLTVGELLETMGERGYALLVMLLCAIFLTPIPLPGLSTIFGAAVFALGTSLSLQVRPWLPVSWQRRRISSRQALSLIAAAERIMGHAKGWARPRGDWAKGPRFHRFCGIGVAVCGLILALPLPPGGNFMAALGAVLFSIAMLARDGVFALYGALAMILSGAFVALVFWSAGRALDLTGMGAG